MGLLFLLYLLTIKAVIKQTCITLLDVEIEKNLEYFIFRQVTENATLSLDLPKVRTFDSHFLKDARKLFP
jgi:hypothetical protein